MDTSVERLPEFPALEPLGVSHLPRVNELLDRVPQTSDFCLVSLWCWSAPGQFRVAEWQDNLVVEFDAYVEGERCLSFIGNNDPIGTAKVLLTSAPGAELRHIPWWMAEHFKPTTGLVAEEDRDDFDYIYSPSDYRDLRGHDKRRIRHRLNRYRRLVADHEGLRSGVGNHQLICERADQLRDLYKHWRLDGSPNVTSADAEAAAFEQLLQSAELLSRYTTLLLTYVELDDRLISASIGDVREKQFIGHFAKSDRLFGDTGPFVMLMQRLDEMGLETCNGQQDAGIAGLREHKTSYRPRELMRKCVVREAAS